MGPSGGAATEFAPTDLSGLTAWFDPDDMATLWETSDTSTPVDFDNNPSNVGRWLDKSGAARVLSQTSLGRRLLSSVPTGAPADICALTCSAATGTNSDQLDSAIALTSLFGTAAMTAFTVIRSTAAGGVLGDSTGTGLDKGGPLGPG